MGCVMASAHESRREFHAAAKMKMGVEKNYRIVDIIYITYLLDPEPIG